MLRNTHLFVLLLLAILAACSQAPAPEAEGPSEALTPQFGSGYRDEATALAKHSSGVYVAGTIATDAFLVKYSLSGTKLWDRYVRTSGDETVTGMGSDANDNAYVVGTTTGNLAEQYGYSDIFVRKYTTDGAIAWTRQFGSDRHDYAYGAAADLSGNLYVVGLDGFRYFLRKYSPSGTVLWTYRTYTTSPDAFSDVTVDHLSGNVYVAGTGTTGMFLRKFSPNGGTFWVQRVSNYGESYGTAVAVWGNHVYLVGTYLWKPATYEYKVALTKFDANGVQGWSRPYGLNGSDYAYGASADIDGNLYFTGNRYGGPHLRYVGYVAKFNPNLTEVWTKFVETLGGAGYVLSNAVLAGPVNSIYAAGHHYGDVGNGHQGSGDAYLKRLNGVDGATVWTK